MQKIQFAKYCNVQEKSDFQADVSKMSHEGGLKTICKVNKLQQKCFEAEKKCRQLATPVCFYKFKSSEQIA